MKEHPPKSPSASPENGCARCGTCCQKGGPSFHQEDRHLIDNGVIPARCLFTIRQGEFAYDNVKGCLMPVESDIIKIKGKQDTWTCIFLDEAQKTCSIYNDRPLECRSLKCWDTRDLEKMYARHRLTREDLISKVEGLWDLIADHQERCDYTQIQGLITDLDSRHGDDARRRLAQIIRYDIEIRDLAVSRGALEADMLDFLFGRPLTTTLPHYGVKVRRQGKKITLSCVTRR